jgi:mitochondrial inner membrane protease ATP23
VRWLGAQVRASSLSGDCGAMQEFLRGNLSHAFIGQHKKCVRRRATMSVQMNPYCQGVKAEQAVNEVFSKCFRDTDPFDKIPGS